MSVGNPAALWLLLLLPLLLLRRPRPRVRTEVATLPFWREAAQTPRAGFARRPQIDRLMLVQAAFVAALVLALADPTLPLASPRVTVIVDQSASMAALDAGVPRIDAARSRALEVIGRLPWRTRVELVGAHAIAESAGEFGAADDNLRRALDALQPTSSAADLEGAVQRALASDAAHVYVISDNPPDASRVDRSRLTWLGVGSGADNVAVTDVSVSARDDGRAHVLVSVRNFGRARVSTELTLTHDGRVVSREPLTIESRATVSVLRGTDAGGSVTAAIAVDDALSADNHRTAPVAASFVRRVRVEDANVFVARAVGASPLVAMTGDADADIVICQRCATAAATRVLRVPAVAAQRSEPSPVVLSGIPHPVTESLPLSGVMAVATDGAPPDDNSVVLASAGGRPLIVATDDGQRRVVDLRLDPAGAGFAFDAVFPMLIASAMAWLSDDRSADSQGIPTAESDLLAVSSAAETARPPDTRALQTNVTRIFLAAALVLALVEWRLRLGRAWQRRDWLPVRPAALVGPAIVVMLTAAVAGLHLPVGRAPVSVMVALDRSDSMAVTGGEPAAAITRTTAAMRDGDRAGLIVFGASAAVERRLGPELVAGPIASSVDAAATNIESALRAARANLPAAGSRRVVLVSDGQQTAGDAEREARVAAQEGVRIDVVMPRTSVRGDAVTVTALTAPATVRAGEPFELLALVHGRAGDDGEVVLTRDGAEPIRAPVTIPAAGTATVRFRDQQTETGAYTYRVAAAHPADDFGPARQAPSAGAVVFVTGEPRVLHIGGTATMAAAIREAGFAVDAIVPTAAPASSAGFERYDAVLLDDVRGDELGETQSAALADYVERLGGGVWILGGERSLEPAFGGNATLAALSPVDFRARTGERAPGVAMVIVFDKSGSMDELVDGAPKLEYARQAVRRVVELLSPGDRVGVIAFDATAVPVVPLESGHTVQSINDRLRATQAAGSTAIAPALELARRWLQDAGDGPRRRILLVSDGQTSPADAARAAAAVERTGIEVSVVAVGARSDRRMLETLAANTGGRAYFPDDVRELPRLLAREATRVGGGHVMNEPFTVGVATHALTSGLGDDGRPRLGGYVVGTATATAEAALVSHLGDPILATARRGLGRVAIYTAGLQTPWSAGLRAWDRFPALLAQTLRWTSRRFRESGVYTSIEPRDNGIHLVVESPAAAAADGPMPDVRAVIRPPAGDPIETVLTAFAPGRYRGDIPLPGAGPYLLSLAVAGNGADARLVRGFYWSAHREGQARGANRALLTALARITGGDVLDAAAATFARPRDLAFVSVAAGLAAAALTLFYAALFGPALAALLRAMVASFRATAPVAGAA